MEEPLHNSREKRIGLELRRLNNLTMRYLENHTNKKMVDSITGTNGWIIGYLADHDGQDVFQRDLEAHFGITRSTASKVINLMEQKGLVRRESVPQDARLKKLVLTEKAKKVSAIMAADRNAVEARLLQGFTQEEIALLYGYLVRMQQNMGRPAAESNKT